ncbi:transposase [Streptomyces sp. NPDC094472]|uniref:transposase n=1 Tax=Streptomyces sp. NPDC094472 TaxID=3155080 RepID=UPI0033249009
MLRRAHAAGVRASFFAGDEVYGGRDLRRTCRALGMVYAVAVRTNHRVTTAAGPLTCKDALKKIPARAWQRMRTGTGTKSACDYDWAMLEVVADDTPHGQDGTGVSVLLVTRPVPLARLVWVVCRRWKIEEDFQACKNATALDKVQVTTWTSWQRWSTAALVACAFLAVATALERAAHGEDEDAAEPELIPLTCHELLRWSAWRRRHQHRARTCHMRWHAYADATP